MINKIKFSVIIPTYNRTEVLINAIDSVLKQSYKPIEIIVVDDCSKVDIKKYIKSTKLIKIIKNKKNVGAAESRNIGVRKSKGDYVAFLDSDDYWHKDKLKVFANELILQKFDLMYSDEFIVKADNTVVSSQKKIIQTNFWNELVDGWTAPNTSTLVVNRDMFLKSGGFDSNDMACEDHDLWMNFAMNGYTIKGINQKLVFFTYGGADRISFKFDRRINGAMRFCSKWGPIIQKKNGLKKAIDFKKDYINKVSFPIFVNAVKSVHLIYALRIYFQYLVFNKFFYLLLLHVFKNKLRRLNGYR